MLLDIPTAFQNTVNNSESIEISANTISEVFVILQNKYPQLSKHIIVDGKLLPYVILFHNNKYLPVEEHNIALNKDDKLSLKLAISGG